MKSAVAKSAVSPFDANGFPLAPGLRLLEASAGTGKTFALAHLVLRLVGEEQLGLGELLVVTFTEAAAAELRDRIGQRLSQAQACLADPSREIPDPVLASWLDHWGESGDRSGGLASGDSTALQARLLMALEELDSADITTIHGFCRRTLQRQALEAGQPPDLQLEAESGPLVRQVAHDYWQQQVLALPEHLLAGLMTSIKGPQALEPLLAQLDGDPALQLDPLPPGLGLEEPLAPQLEGLWQGWWHDLNQHWPQRGAELEASLRAAAAHWRELGCKSTGKYSPKPTKDRRALLDSWLQGSDLDSQQRGDYGAIRGQELLSEYFHPGAFLKVARPIEAPTSGDPSLPQPELMGAIAAAMEGPAEALLLHACHWGRAELKARRERRGRLGFAQLLEGLDPGEQASTPLLRAVGERYRAALIDEFQDTDPIQWRILAGAFQPSEHRIVLVGDPKQAIYRFRGGELATYLLARECARKEGGISSLQNNFRSSQPLLEGLNRLMAPGLRRSELEVLEVRAMANKGTIELAAGEQPLQLLWLGADRPAGSPAPSRSQLDQMLPKRIAAFTAQLLARRLVISKAHQGDQAGQGEILGANGICLLVGTHSQAEALRQALEYEGIASRLVSKGDVLESEGAGALQRFLDALADPANPNRLRLLAASALLGWSAEQLASTTAEQWGELAARLGAMAEQLPRRGLLGILGSLLEEQGLARLSLGGRLLADLQQSAELVQECLHTERLGPAAAADWLRRRRLDPVRDVPEAHQPHSDAVDAAVSVVTVHRSKGLEYPVVICPYLWQAPSTQARAGQRLGVRWHPPDAALGAPVLDLHLNGHWGRGYQARSQQLEAELAERERLAYVAATRAQQLLVLAWGPAHGQGGNPLSPWLFSQEQGDCDYTSRSDADWLELLKLEMESRRVPIELLTGPAAGAAASAARSAEPAAAPTKLGRGPVPERNFDSRWGRSSYTSWTKGSHGAAPQALEEGRETDDPSQEVAQLGAQLGAQVGDQDSITANWSDQGPLAQFPRGAQAGDCLHRILEQIDYQQEADHPCRRGICERELQRSGIDINQADAVLLGLQQLLDTPLGGPLGPFKLNQLGQGQRLNELNFDLPIALVEAQALATCFAGHPGGQFGASYAASLAQLSVASEGFLTGSMDLIFRAADRQGQPRWWVADWKSNWLGERDANGKPLACGPLHYTTAAMAGLMEANHYPLQAHLYLVALHRYLRWRLSDYEPERDLGGSLYLFLRGVPGASPQALAIANNEELMVPGVFVDIAPLERLLALDRLLGNSWARGLVP
ncbi:UvrD-helicase domain-containing protein [Cyanobium sp. WAJ14-Wanaka]|uniref:UvrD-helicase domain-containing protein n=1 Tax=Cyanobium sp. WAJ14-Wanaka TaxID=2823725 RepID=UPI0020CBFCDF|nr:UvrD-helicase domain-containing protein [Cyanobium sp. WAJ14-Wanaka]MCP9774267.1 UvrD-helicase domain-containing protein [Cyanobium sp. WAJ14-Wanaka]